MLRLRYLSPSVVACYRDILAGAVCATLVSIVAIRTALILSASQCGYSRRLMVNTLRLLTLIQRYLQPAHGGIQGGPKEVATTSCFVLAPRPQIFLNNCNILDIWAFKSMLNNLHFICFFISSDICLSGSVACPHISSAAEELKSRFL